MVKSPLTAFSEEEYRMIKSFKTHFEELDSYPAVYLVPMPPDFSPSSPRDKLTRVPMHPFHVLSTDVYEELMRRRYASAVPFLPARDDYHPKRNRARQGLATLPKYRFDDRCSAMHHELLRRYPEFRVNWRRIGFLTSKL